jgi:histone H3/H4
MGKADQQKSKFPPAGGRAQKRKAGDGDNGGASSSASKAAKASGSAVSSKPRKRTLKVAVRQIIKAQQSTKKRRLLRTAPTQRLIRAAMLNAVDGNETPKRLSSSAERVLHTALEHHLVEVVRRAADFAYSRSDKPAKTVDHFAVDHAAASFDA